MLRKKMFAESKGILFIYSIVSLCLSESDDSVAAGGIKKCYYQLLERTVSKNIFFYC